MRDDLLSLINKIDQIESNFYLSGKNLYIIYDNPKFLEWKQEIQFELQEVFSETQNQFVWDTLVICKQDFRGWHDRESFEKLKGNLIAIRKNIKKFFPNESEGIKMNISEDTKDKKPKIFISHSSKDEKYANLFVELFLHIGLYEHQVFCSSLSGVDIPLGNDIYEYLKNNSVIIICMWCFYYQIIIIIVRQH